jgi:ribosomal protein S18 acetylase RimI-like enzyme
MEANSFWVRAAHPSDVPELMRLKRLLAQAENSLHAVCATETDWLRDGFGPNAGFTAFVAENDTGVIGMVTCSQRAITGWNTPIVYLQDLFVEAAHRQAGVAHALVARVAALAQSLGSPIIELTVRSDNPAQNFYQHSGFRPLPECLTYILAGPALAALAEQSQMPKPPMALAG